jgi:flagellar motor protein MotB
MRALGWACLVALLPGCGVRELKERLAEQERELTDLRALNGRLATELTEARAEAAKGPSAPTPRPAEVKPSPPSPVPPSATPAPPALDKLRAALEQDLSGSGVTVLVQGNRLVLRAPVGFETGKATPTGAGKALLARIGKALAARAGTWEIGVAGHADASRVRTVGTRFALSINWQLSGQRALAAMEQLMEATGLSPARFHFRGYGEYRPVGPNTTAEGREANRRIEIILEPTT